MIGSSDNPRDMAALISSVYKRILTSCPQEVADRVRDVRLLVENVGDLNCTACSRQRLIVLDSQLLGLTFLWSSLFSWAQLHLTTWCEDARGQRHLSQRLVEFYVIQNRERRIPPAHWDNLMAFAAVQHPVLGKVHTSFLFLAMAQFILCHELGHFFMHKRHFQNASLLRRATPAGTFEATVPDTMEYENEADEFGTELSFSVARRACEEPGVWGSTNDLAAPLFMVFMSTYEYVLAHLISQVEPDALRNFRRSHPPTRERCRKLLYIQRRTDPAFDGARLAGVHQASLMNALIMKHFQSSNYEALQKYGIHEPSNRIEEPGLFFYDMEDLYSGIRPGESERDAPRGVEHMIRKYAQL